MRFLFRFPIKLKGEGRYMELYRGVFPFMPAIGMQLILAGMDSLHTVSEIKFWEADPDGTDLGPLLEVSLDVEEPKSPNSVKMKELRKNGWKLDDTTQWVDKTK